MFLDFEWSSSKEVLILGIDIIFWHEIHAGNLPLGIAGRCSVTIIVLSRCSPEVRKYLGLKQLFAHIFITCKC